jgi:hypothetical protein
MDRDSFSRLAQKEQKAKTKLRSAEKLQLKMRKIIDLPVRH